MQKIYLYGASNTDGFDPRGMLKGRYDSAFRFPDVLQKALGPEWQVVEDGLNGRKIPGAGFLSDYFLQKLQAAMPLDYVAVMLGTNDVLSMREPDVIAIASRLEQLCLKVEKSLKQKDEQVRLLIMTPPPLDLCDDDGINLGDVIAELQQAYQELAYKHGWDFVDTRPWNLELSYDGIHLSEKGSQEMGLRLAEWLKLIDNRMPCME